MVVFSSHSLMCMRDCADLETNCRPGQIALNLSFPQLRDVDHVCRKAVLWQCLLCPKFLLQKEGHITWRLAVRKNVCMVLGCFCGFCTHKRLFFSGGFLNRCFISLDFKQWFLLVYRSLMEIWNPSRRQSASLGTLNIFTVLSFTYPRGDISSAEARILYRNTSSVQKRCLSP